MRELLTSVPEDRKLILSLDDPFLRDRLTGTEGGLLRAIEEQAARPWSAIVPPFTLVLDDFGEPECPDERTFVLPIWALA